MTAERTLIEQEGCNASCTAKVMQGLCISVVAVLREKMSQDKHNTTNITEMALTSLKAECFKRDIKTAEQLLSNQGEVLMQVLRENRPYWRECPHCEAFHKPRRDKKVADCKKRGRALPGFAVRGYAFQRLNEVEIVDDGVVCEFHTDYYFAKLSDFSSIFAPRVVTPTTVWVDRIKRPVIQKSRNCIGLKHPHCSICGMCHTNARTHDRGHPDARRY